MNLMLAIVWLFLAVGVFGWEFLTGQPGPRMWGNLSFGWLGLLLCLYNLARWWGEKTYRREQQALREAQDRRYWETRRKFEPGGDIDPNFDFTAEPPPPPRTNITDQPPSPN